MALAHIYCATRTSSYSTPAGRGNLSVSRPHADWLMLRVTRPDASCEHVLTRPAELLHERRDINPHIFARNLALARLQKVQDPEARAPFSARSPQNAPHHMSRPNGLVNHEIIAVMPAHRLHGFTREVAEQPLIILASRFPASDLAARGTHNIMLHIFGERANDTVHIVLSFVLEMLVDDPIHLFAS